jgi:DNA-binding NarL/FixJ family response regulator
MNEHGQTTVLFVEDSPLDAFLVRAGLEKAFAQAQLLHTERLCDALGLLKNQHIDLVLTDLNLPDSFGPDTARALVEAAGAVPVLVLMGDGASDIHQRVSAAGACGAITKDTLANPQLLAQAIGNALDAHRGS